MGLRILAASGDHSILMEDKHVVTRRKPAAWLAKVVCELLQLYLSVYMSILI